MDKYSMASYSKGLRTPQQESSVSKWDQTPTKDTNFSNELFTNLKKNYEERIKFLEMQIRDTYQIIDHDEILNTMKLNSTSDEFRKQRVHEIVEDSLLTEKEIQIDKLSQINAYLKTELQKSEEEKQRIRTSVAEELSRYQQAVGELEQALQREVKTKTYLQDENEKTTARLNQVSRSNDELLKKKEAQFAQHTQLFQNEFINFKHEYEDVKERNIQLEQALMAKEKLVEEMQKDLDIFRKEYGKLEANYSSVLTEQTGLAKNCAALKEANFKLDSEIKNVLERNKKLEDELDNTQNNLQGTLKEKNELIGKTEYISSQVKKIVENEQKNSTEIAKDLKAKYKTKMLKLKKTIEDLKQFNEGLNNDNLNTKHQVEEIKLAYEKTVSSLQNDMKIVRNEWEKKCQEIDLNAQRQLAESKAKHQLQINQLQSEYQSLLDKRLNEIQNEANSQITKTKTVDGELKNQLESRLSQMEKDYILRSKHENILTSEMLELKTKHAQAVKEIEEKYEAEISEKIKDVLEKKKLEYEGVIATLKNSNKNLEQAITEIKQENRKLAEISNQEKEKAMIRGMETDEVDKNRKALIENLEDANQAISKLKQNYEDALKKSKKIEFELGDSQRKIDDLTEKLRNQDTLVSNLREDNATISQARISAEEKNDDFARQIKMLNNEIEKQKYLLESAKKERDDLDNNIRQLNDNYTQETQNYLELISNLKKEEAVKLEKETSEQLKLRTKVNQLEGKLKSTSLENTDMERKISELKNQIAINDEQINEYQQKLYDTETALGQVENQNRESLKRIEKINAKHFEIKNKMYRFFSMKISNLKSEWGSLKNSCQLEVQMNRKFIENCVNEVVAYMSSRIGTLKTDFEETKEKLITKLTTEHDLKFKNSEVQRLEEKLKDQGQLDRVTQETNSILERLKTENNELRNDLARVRAQLDEYKTANGNLKSRLEKLDSEKMQLQETLVQRMQEFENLQGYITREINRLKEDSEQTLNESLNQLEERHRRELATNQQVIDELKLANITRLQKFESEISKLQSTFIMDMQQLRNIYELKIDSYEKELSLLENDWCITKRDKKMLKLEMEKLQEHIKRIQEENHAGLANFEEKIEHFKEMMRQDNEKYLQSKNQQNAENEKLRRDIKELNRELVQKNQRIDEVSKLKEEQKGEVAKLKTQLDHKEKQVENHQKEVQKISKYRDKEIEELQTLLAKSLHSINNSMDNNMRMAAKLDKETEEIAKSIKFGKSTSGANSARPINIVDYERLGTPETKSEYYGQYQTRK